MTRCPQSVTLTHVPSDRLPDWSGEGVTLLLDLQRRGLLAQVEEQFRIARQGGFAGFDVFLFLLYFFGSRMKGGLRNFWVSASVHGEALAAVGGRVRLPSPAAISRALGIVDPELPRSLSGRLLMEVRRAVRTVVRRAAPEPARNRVHPVVPKAVGQAALISPAAAVA